MLFNIEIDQGDKITGYVVLDDYESSPTIQIMERNVEIAVLKCAEVRPSLVMAGRHATGLCGFTIDGTIAPGIETRFELEIYEISSGILIYRRRPPEQVLKERVFRLETHLFPLWTFDGRLEGRFQYFHKGLERHGRETTTQAFLQMQNESVYLSGRLNYKTYVNQIQDVFKSITLLHEPYMELAERLLTLRHISKFGEELLGARDTMMFQPAIEFAQGVTVDEKQLRAAFAGIPRPVIALLADPVTRLLSAENLSDPTPKGAIGKALTALGAFTIVGLRDRQDKFLEELEHLILCPPGFLPETPTFATVSILAETLRSIPEVELLLERDLEIYKIVHQALDAAH